MLKPSSSSCGQVRGRAAVGAADPSCPSAALPILRGRTHTVLCCATSVELAMRAVGSQPHSLCVGGRQREICSRRSELNCCSGRSPGSKQRGEGWGRWSKGWEVIPNGKGLQVLNIFLFPSEDHSGGGARHCGASPPHFPGWLTLGRLEHLSRWLSCGPTTSRVGLGAAARARPPGH